MRCQLRTGSVAANADGVPAVDGCHVTPPRWGPVAARGSRTSGLRTSVPASPSATRDEPAHPGGVDPGREPSGNRSRLQSGLPDCVAHQSENVEDLCRGAMPPEMVLAALGRFREVTLIGELERCVRTRDRLNLVPDLDRAMRRMNRCGVRERSSMWTPNLRYGCRPLSALERYAPFGTRKPWAPSPKRTDDSVTHRFPPTRRTAFPLGTSSRSIRETARSCVSPSK